MKKYDFDVVVPRKGTFSLKWDSMQKALPKAPADAIPMWVADMDFAVADPIVDALHQCVNHKIFGYSDMYYPAYLQSVQRWFEKRYHWKIQAESIRYSPGIVPAISTLIRILSQEGDRVLIQNPVYYPFANMIRGNHREVICNPLVLKDGVYSMDFEHLEKQLADPGVKLMILCSPHNPVGRVWRRDELEKIIALCQRYDVWLISDEIHCDLTRKNIDHLPTHLLAGEYLPKVIACTSPTKTFNLAGIHLSNIIIPDEKIRQKWDEEVLERLAISSPSPFAIAAAIAAYNEGGEWLDQLQEYLDGNMAFIQDFLQTSLPSVRFSIPDATYLAWLDFREYEKDPAQLEEKILVQAKVALDEGYIFGEGGAGFERINVACPRSVLQQALEQIAAVFS